MNTILIINLSLYVVLNLLDLLTTKIFLLLGVEEGNPLGRYLLNKFGFNGLIFFKIIGIIVIMLLCLFSPSFIKIIPLLNLLMTVPLILNCKRIFYELRYNSTITIEEKT